MDASAHELKQKIIQLFDLKKITPEQIADDAPLFGDGLGLDSIDALELIVLLQQHYNIKLANPQDGPQIFKSVKSIAEYIKANQPA